MIGALALGAAFGPLAAGAAFDHWGSYKQFLVLTMVFMAASSLAMATLSRPVRKLRFTSHFASCGVATSSHPLLGPLRDS